MPWLGTEISEALNELGVGVSELAETIGVSRQTLNNWTTGRKAPRGDHLVALSKALGVSPSQFFSPDNSITVPQHRNNMGRRTTPEISAEAQEMASIYRSLFREPEDTVAYPVLRVSSKSDENALRIANWIRSEAGMDSRKPMDFKAALRFIRSLGVYLVFRPFIGKIADSNAFYVKINRNRVIFVNTRKKIRDVIFHLIHEVVHALRDEGEDTRSAEETLAEERFCDRIAAYAQFPDSYVSEVRSAIYRKKAGSKVNILKSYCRDHDHSFYGIWKRLEEDGAPVANISLGAHKNFQSEDQALEDVLVNSGDASVFIGNLDRLSPEFLDLVTMDGETYTDGALGELLGLGGPEEAAEVRPIIKARQLWGIQSP